MGVDRHNALLAVTGGSVATELSATDAWAMPLPVMGTTVRLNRRNSESFNEASAGFKSGPPGSETGRHGGLGGQSSSVDQHALRARGRSYWSVAIPQSASRETTCHMRRAHRSAC